MAEVLDVAAATTTNEQVNNIKNSYTVQEFKDEFKIDSFEVLQHKDDATRMFMSSKGRSIGTVSKTYNPSEPSRVIEVADTNDVDGMKTLFILTNSTNSTYVSIVTL